MNLQGPSLPSLHRRSSWDGVVLLFAGMLLGAEITIFIMRTFFCV